MSVEETRKFTGSRRAVEAAIELSKQKKGTWGEVVEENPKIFLRGKWQKK